MIQSLLVMWGSILLTWLSSYPCDGPFVHVMVHSLVWWSICWCDGPFIDVTVHLLVRWSICWCDGPFIYVTVHPLVWLFVCSCGSPLSTSWHTRPLFLHQQREKSMQPVSHGCCFDWHGDTICGQLLSWWSTWFQCPQLEMLWIDWVMLMNALLVMWQGLHS